MSRSHWSLLAALALAGCAGDTDDVTPMPSADATVLGEGAAEPEPHLEGRSHRRMDVDQLSASIERATGGIRWTEERNGVEVDLFEELAPTLGKPDYLQTTDEDLTPSLLFQKFLDDAAISVCGKLMAREATGSGDATFLVAVSPTDTAETAPEAVEANLQAAVLRFHGRKLAAGAPELEPWTWLFRSATAATSDPMVGWNAVCIGLITHPDFYSY